MTELEKISPEEINSMFGEENDYSNKEKKPTEERLLSKQQRTDFQPITRPYYKRPIVQIFLVLSVGVPVIWLILAAFNPGDNLAKNTESENPLQQENADLKESLDSARNEIDRLSLDSAKNAQEEQIKLVESRTEKSVEPEPEPKPEPKPEPLPTPKKAISTPPPPPTQKVVYRNLYPNPVSPPPSVRPTPIKDKPDPAQQWLEQSHRGAWISNAPQQNHRDKNNKTTKKSVRGTEIDLFSQEYFDETQKLEENLSSRLKDGAAILANKNTQNNQDNEELSLQPIPQKNPEKLLDIGSNAQAVLNEGVAWVQSRSNQNSRKYILNLKEDFKNSIGTVVLPKDTRLIAMVKSVSSSGLFFMEVIEVVQSLQEKISVPSGTLEIVSKDGSPLKADLKKKNSSQFWANAGVVIAPGLESALDSIGDQVDVSSNGSSIRVSGNSNPVAKGASGLIEGGSDLLNQRVRQSSNNRPVSYFEFDSKKTVLLRVNEDFYLP